MDSRIEGLFAIPSYSAIDADKIDRMSYDILVQEYSEALSKALKFWGGYNKTKSLTLFDMSLESLRQAHEAMHMVFEGATEDVAETMGRKATFLFDLVSAVAGL